MTERRCPNCECVASPMTHFSRGRRLCDYCRASLARKGQAWCPGCERPVALAEWRKWRCAACYAAYRRTRYERNAELERATSAAWREANRDKVLAMVHSPERRARVSAWRRAQREQYPELVRERERRQRHRRTPEARARKNEWQRQRYAAMSVEARQERRTRKLLRILRGAA